MDKKLSELKNKEIFDLIMRRVTAVSLLACMDSFSSHDHEETYDYIARLLRELMNRTDAVCKEPGSVLEKALSDKVCDRLDSMLSLLYNIDRNIDRIDDKLDE